MLTHIAGRLHGVPLLIYRPKLDAILAAIGERVGLRAGGLPMPWSPNSQTRLVIPRGVAVIPIYGTLVKRTLGLEAQSGLTSYLSISTQLSEALADPEIKGVLLDIDSPGGEASGVFDLADQIAAARLQKPIFAVANDMAFSAAYAIAAAADKVFVTRTGGVGSIGVIALHVDQSAKDAQDGCRYTAVFAGAHKNDLTPHAPMSDAGFSALTAEVNRIYDLFVNSIANNRKLNSSAIQKTEAGLYFANDAIQAGLADVVGNFEDALLALDKTISTKVASVSAGQHLSSTLKKEQHMSQDIETVSAEILPPTFPTPSTQNIPLATAIDIVDTCVLAGFPEQITGFLQNGTSPPAVRQALLTLKAQASPEIFSRIPPETQMESPLVRIIRQRILTSKKE